MAFVFSSPAKGRCPEYSKGGGVNTKYITYSPLSRYAPAPLRRGAKLREQNAKNKTPVRRVLFLFLRLSDSAPRDDERVGILLRSSGLLALAGRLAPEGFGSSEA